MRPRARARRGAVAASVPRSKSSASSNGVASPNAAFEFSDNFTPVSAFTKSIVLSSISYFAKSASMSVASTIVFRVFMVSAVTREGKETMRESTTRVATTARWENGGVTLFCVVLVLSEETVLWGYVRVPIVVRVCVVLWWELEEEKSLVKFASASPGVARAWLWRGQDEGSPGKTCFVPRETSFRKSR